MFLLLLACTQEAPPDTPADSPPLSSWSYDEEPEAARYTAAQVEEMAAPRLPQLLGINPFLVYEAYETAMAAQDPDCPGTYEIAGVIGWGADCSSRAGWTYWGRSQGIYLVNSVVDDVAYETWGSLLTNARLTSPDDEVLRIVGYSDLWETKDGERRALYSYLLGEFTWNGPGSEETWLRDNLSVALIVESSWEPGGAMQLRVDGGVSAIDKDNPTLNAVNLTMTSAQAGGACTQEPAGALQLTTRDPQTYLITFDGTACDGCGAVSYRDEQLGDACFDFSDMLSWEERPWSWR